MKTQLHYISGYNKTTKIEFSNHLVSSDLSGDCKDIFFYGLCGQDIRSVVQRGEDTGLPFVINSFKRVIVSRDKKIIVKSEEYHQKIFHLMERLGGGFVSALAVCYSRADNINKIKIIDTWGGLIQDYEQFL